MKKYLKITSVALAVLMLVLALPLTAMAKTLTVKGNWQPIIKLDNLADTTNELNSEYTVNNTIGYKGNAKLSEDGDKVLRTNANGTYWAYSVVTNIVLDTSSEYRISFKAQGLETTATKFGLCFG